VYRAGITAFALDPENSAVENAIMSANALGKGVDDDFRLTRRLG
jgi:hypothetical protein